MDFPLLSLSFFRSSFFFLQKKEQKVALKTMELREIARSGWDEPTANIGTHLLSRNSGCETTLTSLLNRLLPFVAGPVSGAGTTSSSSRTQFVPVSMFVSNQQGSQDQIGQLTWQ